MMRAQVLDTLEAALAELGFTTQSEPTSKRLIMADSNGKDMSAEVSEGSNYGYLQVNDRQGIVLLIRLGTEAPYIYPHQVRIPAGRELLQYLVDNCEQFRKEWLRHYLRALAEM